MGWRRHNLHSVPYLVHRCIRDSEWLCGRWECVCAINIGPCARQAGETKTKNIKCNRQKVERNVVSARARASPQLLATASILMRFARFEYCFFFSVLFFLWYHIPFYIVIRLLLLSFRVLPLTLSLYLSSSLSCMCNVPFVLMYVSFVLFDPIALIHTSSLFFYPNLFFFLFFLYESPANTLGRSLTHSLTRSLAPETHEKPADNHTHTHIQRHTGAWSMWNDRWSHDTLYYEVI